jgi:hypothetical protein
VPGEPFVVDVSVRFTVSPTGRVSGVDVSGKLPESAVRCIERRALEIEVLVMDTCGKREETEFMMGMMRGVN